MKTIIKKHSNRNHYLLTEHGHWVRDFTQPVYPTDINKFVTESEYTKLVSNELKNASFNLASIDMEYVKSPNVVIVSDGYKFAESKHLLKSLPKNTTIIGTNRALANWPAGVKMDYFVVNNPFKDCMSYFPTSKYVPRCIVSRRTWPDFVRRYKASKGVIYQYAPVKSQTYGGVGEGIYSVDDYRNPICAAIGLAYRWGVSKLLLFCCDEVFNDNRPGAVKVGDVYTYPQNEVAHSLIDANLYWLRRQEFHEVKVGAFSTREYQNSEYIIKDESELKEFF